MGELLLGPAYRWKRLCQYCVLSLASAGVIGQIGSLLHRQVRTAEANAAMLASPAPIDGQRAFGYLKQICDIGPRTAGSEANARQRKLVAAHFALKGGKVRE